MELWIVFHDEGLSLRRYLYTPHQSDNIVIFEPSDFWKQLRLADGGREVLKVIMQQILEGAQVLHEKNITHRDLKVSWWTLFI